MIYMYDIILNFQKNYYQFFEWKTEDKIVNYTKIPLYHISTKDLLILKNNNVKIRQDLINKIKEDNKQKKKLICIVCNKEIAIALQFDSNGLLKKRSSLIFEEEEEAVRLSKKIKKISITYEFNKKVKCQNVLRIEKEKKNAIISYIKNSKDIITLKYLYYDYSEKELNDLETIKDNLIKEISKEWNEKHNKIYKLIGLLQKTI